MNIAIISSKADTASMNIRHALLDSAEWQEQGTFQDNPVYTLPGDNLRLYTIGQKHILAENLDKQIRADLFVFVSKHRAEEGRQGFTSHIIGNWGRAELGGREKALVQGPALYVKALLKELEETNTGNYDIAQEATHHGPYLDKPAFFAEIGSNEEHWPNPELGRTMAETLLKILTNPVREGKTIVALGGPHYLPNFTAKLEHTEYAIGHACPKHSIPGLTKELLQQAIDRTIPRPEMVLLDWKGLGPNKDLIRKLTEACPVPVERLERFR